MNETGSPATTGVARLRHVDLALGAWRPHEAANQLAGTLGVALPPAPVIGQHPLDGGDAAAAGAPGILHAHEAARRTAAALPANAAVVVFAPRFGLPLRQDNEWFFLFLKRRGVSIVLTGDEVAPTVISQSVFERRRAIEEPRIGSAPTDLSAEQRRILRFFPGLLPRSLASELGVSVGSAMLVPAGLDHLLIPPGYRDTDPRDAAGDLDGLADLEALDDGLKALAQSFCTAHFADDVVLSTLAEAAAGAGLLDLAHDLAERARQVARTPEAMATADIGRMKMWRSEGLHGDILAVPPPSRQASEASRKALERLKLEAAVAIGDFETAGPGLAPLEQRLLAKGPLATKDLVLLDEVATARAAAGETDDALALAEAAQDVLAREPEADHRLVFRNAVGRARIHIQRREPDLSRVALDTAFAKSVGVRGFAEIVEMNALRASGEPDQTVPAAKQAWLRAALAWLAFEPPEALSLGAIRSVLGPTGFVRSRLDLDISETLADRMAAAWPDVEIRQGDQYPAFRAATATHRPAKLLGCDGACVLWGNTTDTAPVYVRSRIRLVRLVHAVLATLCPAMPDPGKGVFLVDDNGGVDIVATRDEALSLALRTRVDEAVFGTESIALDAAGRSRMTGGLFVRLSPAIVAIEGERDRLSLRFRRSQADTVVTGREAAAIDSLRNERRMSLGSLAVLVGETMVNAERLYREIEASGYVRVEVGSAEESTEPPRSSAAP